MSTDENPQLKEAKALLRSVLIGSKDGVLAGKVPGEYKLLTGETLPYRKMGFSNLDDFARSVPDVIRIGCNRMGETVYHAVANEATAHIQKLVSKQRSKNKVSRPTAMMRRPMYRPQSHQVNQYPAPPYGSSYRYRGSSGMYRSSRHQDPLLSQPHIIRPYTNRPNGNASVFSRLGLPLSSEPRMRRDRVGNPMTSQPPSAPWQSSDVSIQSNQQTVRDVFLPQTKSGMEFENLKITLGRNGPSHVSKPYDFDGSNENRISADGYKIEPNAVLPRVQHPSSAFIKENVSQVTVQPRLYQPHGVTRHKSSTSYEVPPRFQKMLLSSKDDDLTDTPVNPPDAPKPVTVTMPFQRRHLDISKKIELAEVSDGATYLNLLKEYCLVNGESPPRYETMEWSTGCGYASTVHVKGTTFGSLDVFRTQSEAEGAAATMACESLDLKPGKSVLIPPVDNEAIKNRDPLLQHKVEQLLAPKPNGVWLTRLQFEYKERFKEEAPVNLASIVQEWTDLVTLQSIPGTDRCIMYWIEKDVIIPAAERLSIGLDVFVWMSWISTDGVFYVQREESCINDMSEELQTLIKESLTLPKSALCPNLFCAALYTEDETWYRAQITKCFIADNRVDVLYVDYGNADTVLLSNLRKLPTKTAYTPAYAVKCCLRSSDSQCVSAWSPETMKTFANLTEGQTLVAKTTAHTDDGRCIVDLFTQSSSTSINDQLFPPVAENDTHASIVPENSIAVTSPDTNNITLESISPDNSSLRRYDDTDSESFIVLDTTGFEHEDTAITGKRLHEKVSENYQHTNNVDEMEEELVSLQQQHNNPNVTHGPLSQTDRPTALSPVFTETSSEASQDCVSTSDESEVKKSPDDPDDLIHPGGEYWNVFVCFILSVNNITIRLVGEDYSDKLDILEGEIGDWFEEQDQEDPERFYEGCICVARGKISYNRVRIVTLKEGRAECFFLDHGDIVAVCYDQLRILPPSMNYLAYQTIHCSLDGFEHLVSDLDVLDRLCDNVLGHTFIAKVFKRRSGISLILFDTRGDDDVDVNAMIKKMARPPYSESSEIAGQGDMASILESKKEEHVGDGASAEPIDSDQLSEEFLDSNSNSRKNDINMDHVLLHPSLPEQQTELTEETRRLGIELGILKPSDMEAAIGKPSTLISVQTVASSSSNLTESDISDLEDQISEQLGVLASSVSKMETNSSENTVLKDQERADSKNVVSCVHDSHSEHVLQNSSDSSILVSSLASDLSSSGQSTQPFPVPTQSTASLFTWPNTLSQPSSENMAGIDMPLENMPDIDATLENIADIDTSVENIDRDATVENVPDIDGALDHVSDIDATIDSMADIDATVTHSVLSPDAKSFVSKTDSLFNDAIAIQDDKTRMSVQSNNTPVSSTQGFLMWRPGHLNVETVSSGESKAGSDAGPQPVSLDDDLLSCVSDSSSIGISSLIRGVSDIKLGQGYSPVPSEQSHNSSTGEESYASCDSGRITPAAALISPDSEDITPVGNSSLLKHIAKEASNLTFKSISSDIDNGYSFASILATPTESSVLVPAGSVADVDDISLLMNGVSDNAIASVCDITVANNQLLTSLLTNNSGIFYSDEIVSMASTVTSHINQVSIHGATTVTADSSSMDTVTAVSQNDFSNFSNSLMQGNTLADINKTESDYSAYGSCSSNSDATLLPYISNLGVASTSSNAPDNVISTNNVDIMISSRAQLHSPGLVDVAQDVASNLRPDADAISEQRLTIPPVGYDWDVHIITTMDPTNFICTSLEVWDQLQIMMRELDVAMSQTDKDEPLKTLEKFSLYAGDVEGRWFRVYVIAILDEVAQEVSVLLVDYGTFHILNTSQMRPLPAALQKLPYQAVRAKLYDLKPISGHIWTEAAKYEFMLLANGKDLVSRVKAKPVTPDEVVSLILIDTSRDDTDILIHNELIRKGLALHITEC